MTGETKQIANRIKKLREILFILTHHSAML